MEQPKLQELFNEGTALIGTHRTENIFQALEKRSLTDREQDIIQQRISFQRRMFEEYEKRERQRKSKELQEVCPDLTEEEAYKALEYCSDREEEAATELISNPSFRRKIRQTLGLPSLGPLPKLPLDLSGTDYEPLLMRGQAPSGRVYQHPTGPRPRLVDRASLDEGVFVGAFRGKGYPHSRSHPPVRLRAAAGGAGNRAPLPEEAEEEEEGEEELEDVDETAAEEGEDRAAEEREGLLAEDAPACAPAEARPEPVPGSEAAVPAAEASEAASEANSSAVSQTSQDTAIASGQVAPEPEVPAETPQRYGLAMQSPGGRVWLADTPQAREAAALMRPAQEDPPAVAAEEAREALEAGARRASEKDVETEEAAEREGAAEEAPETSVEVERRPQRDAQVEKSPDTDAPEADGPAQPRENPEEAGSGPASSPPAASPSPSKTASPSPSTTPSAPAPRARMPRAAKSAALAFLFLDSEDEGRSRGSRRAKKPAPPAPPAEDASATESDPDVPSAVKRARRGESRGAADDLETDGAISRAARAQASASTRGHLNRGRVRQKSHKTAELVASGRLRTSRGWHNAGYIFPEGFVSRTLFRSSVALDQLCVHECYILGPEGAHWPAPTFVVVARDRPDEPLAAKSCTGCWTGVLRRINAEIDARRAGGEDLPPPPKTAIAGPEYFGLNQVNILEAVEALDPDRQCVEYWAGKALRQRAAAGLPPPVRLLGQAQPARAPSARAPGLERSGTRRAGAGSRRRRREAGTSEDESGGEEAAISRWTGISRATRRRNRRAENGEADDEDDDNPVPDIIDPITLEPVVTPTISPYGHVMGLATWKAVLAESRTCPFTKKPLHWEQCTILTKSNIDRHQDRVIR